MVGHSVPQGSSKSNSANPMMDQGTYKVEEQEMKEGGQADLKTSSEEHRSMQMFNLAMQEPIEDPLRNFYLMRNGKVVSTSNHL